MRLLRIALFTIAAAGCGSNDAYCSATSCPNDPPRTDSEINLCKGELNDACKDEYRAWQDCLRKQDVCTNGTLDASKQQAALTACATPKAALDVCFKKL